MENYELTDNVEKSQYEFHVENYLPKIEYTRLITERYT